MVNEKRRLVDVDTIVNDIRENNKANFFRPDWSSKRVCELLESAPTADAVEIVHARWIFDESSFDVYGNRQYNCSCCGAGETHNPIVKVSYCWCCGARMDGE